jgi:hypothetical protein
LDCSGARVPRPKASGGAHCKMINNQQYHRLMREYQKTKNISLSALRADMSRPTARKYLQTTQTPDQLQGKHTWRTRPDPLEKVWGEAIKMLEDAPEAALRPAVPRCAYTPRPFLNQGKALREEDRFVVSCTAAYLTIFEKRLTIIWRLPART